MKSQDPSSLPDSNTHSVRLPSPHELQQAQPLTDLARVTRRKAIKDIQSILSGRDRRMLLICGPCSIHHTHAAMEYALRLRKLARDVSDEILIVMRTYFEKPRTTIGWKGLIYDPALNENPQPAEGIRIARQLLASINSIGLPCATEFLNPLVGRYFEDAIAYGCIGARTSESQIHRELASSLSLPVGIKNGIDGSPQTAANAIQAARSPQVIFSTDSTGAPHVTQTRGNPSAHMILRGGSSGPNHHPLGVENALSSLAKNPLERPLIIDCSHGNSRKQHALQAKVARDVLAQEKDGQTRIAGIMLESNLVAGNQAFRPGLPHCYGQSITDACIGWEETESLVRSIASERRNREPRRPEMKTRYA